MELLCRIVNGFICICHAYVMDHPTPNTLFSFYKNVRSLCNEFKQSVSLYITFFVPLQIISSAASFYLYFFLINADTGLDQLNDNMLTVAQLMSCVSCEP